MWFQKRIRITFFWNLKEEKTWNVFSDTDQKFYGPLRLPVYIAIFFMLWFLKIICAGLKFSRYINQRAFVQNTKQYTVKNWQKNRRNADVVNVNEISCCQYRLSARRANQLRSSHSGCSSCSIWCTDVHIILNSNEKKQTTSVSRGHCGRGIRSYILATSV